MAVSRTEKLDKLKEKVRKLLNQAADREGTPEGDVFYARAFEIMAAHGFEERDVAQPDERDEVTHRTYEFTGSYTDMQSALLLAVASALHCTGFQQKRYNSTRVAGATVFGSRRHLERLDMLYTLLNPVMIAGARAHSKLGWYDTSTVVKRRSFMLGFSQSVGRRLLVAEERVAHGDGRYALALVDDRERAAEAQCAYARENGLSFTSSPSKRMYDGAAYGAGVDAGAMTDLGQERVRAGRALPRRGGRGGGAFR